MERKIAVVQIVPALNEGGVEGETIDFALYLAKNGHRSVVISEGGQQVKRLEEGGCTHLCYEGIGAKNPSCLRSLFRLRKFLLQEKIDILHLRSRLPAWVGWLVWKSLPQECRPRLITTFHGFYSVNGYSRIMTKGERVIAVSAAIRDHIISCYDINPAIIATVYGGVDEKKFNPQEVPPKKIKILRDKWLVGKEGLPVIMLPGRFTRLKGHLLLLESLARLKMSGKSNFVCLLIGDMESNKDYVTEIKEKIAKYNLQENIIFTGHCSDMPAALSLADIVVSASSGQAEAFGKVAIEAMAMRRMVIATGGGGSLETVIDGETGWLVPPNDVEMMAKKIDAALAAKKLREQFGVAGRRYVLANFTADIMCEKTLEAYQQLLCCKEHK